MDYNLETLSRVANLSTSAQAPTSAYLSAESASASARRSRTEQAQAARAALGHVRRRRRRRAHVRACKLIPQRDNVLAQCDSLWICVWVCVRFVDRKTVVSVRRVDELRERSKGATTHLQSRTGA